MDKNEKADNINRRQIIEFNRQIICVCERNVGTKEININVTDELKKASRHIERFHYDPRKIIEKSPTVKLIQAKNIQLNNKGKQCYVSIKLGRNEIYKV